jgi:hypothetical protein
MRISKNVAVIEKLQGYELLKWNPKTKKTTRIKISENGLNKIKELLKNKTKKPELSTSSGLSYPHLRDSYPQKW